MYSPSTNTRELAENRFIEAANWFEPLDWSEWFASAAPVEVDLGAGDGGFIVERARALPDVNFVAVERLLGRARKIEKKARRFGLGNLRVLRMETLYCIKWLFPPRSIRAFYLLFPDPWPKKRHNRRRIIRGEFLEAVERALTPGGVFHAATDHEEYFAEISTAFAERPGWNSSLIGDKDWLAEKTDFEIQFLGEGKKIGRLRAVWSGK